MRLGTSRQRFPYFQLPSCAIGTVVCRRVYGIKNLSALDLEYMHRVEQYLERQRCADSVVNTAFE